MDSSDVAGPRRPQRVPAPPLTGRRGADAVHVMRALTGDADGEYVDPGGRKGRRGEIAERPPQRARAAAKTHGGDEMRSAIGQDVATLAPVP